MSACPNCGFTNRAGVVNCLKCGGALPNAAPAPMAPMAQPVYAPVGQQPVGVPQNRKSRLAAGLLGIFFGAFGIHNFYLGHTSKGTAQLLITILSCFYLSWVMWIWAFVESIMLLTGATKTDAAGVPLAA